MSDDDLARRAAVYGVATTYPDWRGERRTVPRETVRAVLRALGADRDDARGGDRPHRAGARDAGGPGRRDGDAAPSARSDAAVPIMPRRRHWGFMVQLYALRSRGSWGFGDLRDLADLAVWSARELGAGFVLVNPLHAGDPVPPIEPSPYLPVSRRFHSPLYLRIEDLPEYADAPAAVRRRIAALAAPLLAADHTLDPIDRDAVWAAKRAALELLRDQPVSADRAAAFTAFREREGAALRDFATWCALAEAYGDDWRRWPAPLRDPTSAQVRVERERLADRVGFYCWLQWLLDEQLAAAQRAARTAGMPIGIIHDLALGIHPGGADAWMYRSLLALDMRVGAPPDEFNQRGQEWGFAPWLPHRLAAAGYGPVREMVRHLLRHGGGLRIDHVMQLFRLWWIPAGRPPADGTFVAYDHAAMLDVIGTEARRAGALVVGEDLGTVDDRMRDVLARHRVLGTSMLWFERDAAGAPRWPRDWRRLCLATVGTHDMPPVAGYLAGDHVELRARLGLLGRSAEEEWAEHRRGLAAWAGRLAELDLLPPGFAVDGELDADDVLRVTVALHEFLARTPALLLGVSLADAVGERRTQNQPGTTHEYPNWRVPLADAAGEPVLLDELPSCRRVRAVVQPVAAAIAAGAAPPPDRD